MKDLAKYLGKFLADGIDRTHDAGLPMDFTAKGLTSVIKIGLGNYESKLKASHTKLVKALKTADKMLEYVGDPQCDGDGAYQDGHGNVYQCQWCAEREEIQQALAEAEKL